MGSREAVSHIEGATPRVTSDYCILLSQTDLLCMLNLYIFGNLLS